MSASEQEREALADLIDKIHDPYPTEGGCDLRGWIQGWRPGDRRHVSTVVDEFLDSDFMREHDARLRERAERAEAALTEARSMLDRIEDRQPHDIDGMIFTIPWAQDIVAGSKAIRRVLAEATRGVTP